MIPSEINGITLTMETCEIINVPQKAIKRMDFFGIERNINVDCHGHVNDEYWCDTAVLEFDYKFINTVETDTFGMKGLGDRLKSYKDITVVTICYKNGKYLSIRVPWDSRNDVYNLKMGVDINRRANTEKVLITHDEHNLSEFCFFSDVRNW